jgi:hypothetical protein
MGRMNDPRIPEEEIVPRGREIYETSVRPALGPEDEGKFVVIDVLGGGHAVDDDEEEAFARASGQADPEALFFFARVGTDGAAAPAHRIGAF